MKKNIKVLAIIVPSILGLSLSGILSYYLAGKNSQAPVISQVPTTEIKNGDSFGVDDPKVFNTNAIGYLIKAKGEGEGTHRLLRPGGPSQTVNLISSLTDLDKFVGMRVKVYGETFKSQTGAWFMDVGRVEVIEVNAKPPFDLSQLDDSSEEDETTDKETSKTTDNSTTESDSNTKVQKSE